MPVLFWKNIDSEVKRLNKEVKKGDKKVTAAEVLRRYAKSLGVENEHTK
jgi:predicted ABC-type ATPase